MENVKEIIVKNLLIRTLSSIVFLALMMAGLLVHPMLYLFLMLFCVGMMFLEFYRVSLGSKSLMEQYIGIATSMIGFAIADFAIRGLINPLWLLILLLPIAAMLLPNLHRETRKWLLLPLLYIALPFSLCNYIVFNPEGLFNGTPLFLLFIILWASDSGAYLIGTAFGQKNGHKLCPSISPKKSWEGVFGGMAFAIAAGLILQAFGLWNMEWYHCLVLSFLIASFDVCGDLLESKWKRHFGVKDSGRIMPGHGGLLDRFDGALLAMPVAVAYIELFDLFV